MKAPHRKAEASAVSRPRKVKLKTGPDGFYTQLPNEFFQHLIGGNKLGGQVQPYVVLIIIHLTRGAEGRPEWVNLSLGELAVLCHCDRMGASRALEYLLKAGIIEMREEVRKGCTGPIRSYKITPERWKDAPEYEAPKVETDDEPQFGDPLQNGAKIMVRPGRKPACMPARLSPKDREPLDFRIEYYAGTGSQPVEVSAATEADVLRITVHSSPEANKRGTRGSVHATEQKANITEPIRLSEYRNVVFSLITQDFDQPFDWAVPADQKLFESVFAAAGPDLGVAEFEQYSRQQIRKAHKQRKEIGPGILISFARQAAALPRPPAPSPTPANATDPVLASAEDISELLDLCIICGGDGHGKHRGVATGKPCGPCNGTGRNPNAGGRPC